MGYGWTNWHQQTSYDWKGWAKNFAYKPRWSNPHSDVPDTRYVNTDTVSDSRPMKWPEEYRGLSLWFGPVGQDSVWRGSLLGAGMPVQRVDKKYSRMFTIDNRYGGDLYRDGKLVGKIPAGEKWDVLVPQPVRLHEDGWAVEGYPNLLNKGDRHWYGVEDDGTAHESIWILAKEHGGNNTMLDYCKFAPDGTLLTGVSRNGKAGVVKGNVPWTSLAWNRDDAPHRLGAAFHNLAVVGMNGAASDGTRADWTFPAYGQLFRLSPRVYELLSKNANEEQQAFLDSLFLHGVMPFDTGGNSWGAGTAMIAGSQHKGSTIADMDILITDLELVI